MSKCPPTLRASVTATVASEKRREGVPYRQPRPQLDCLRACVNDCLPACLTGLIPSTVVICSLGLIGLVWLCCYVRLCSPSRTLLSPSLSLLLIPSHSLSVPLNLSLLLSPFHPRSLLPSNPLSILFFLRPLSHPLTSNMAGRLITGLPMAAPMWSMGWWRTGKTRTKSRYVISYSLLYSRHYCYPPTCPSSLLPPYHHLTTGRRHEAHQHPSPAAQ